MYIARGPWRGSYKRLRKVPTFEPLPQLQGDMGERYKKAYPKDAFRNLLEGMIGDFNRELLHESGDQQPHMLRLLQRPWRDAESAILVFLIFLPRCRPKNSPDETKNDLRPFQTIYQQLRQTPIGNGDAFDYWDALLQSDWETLLHAGLVHLEPSIMSMCDVLEVDYEFLVPSPGVNPELVLHEILERQLFLLYYELRKGELEDVRVLYR
jgi:hypothetical protein